MFSNSVASCAASDRGGCVQLRLLRERLEDFTASLDCREQAPADCVPAPSEDFVRRILRWRSMRSRFLNAELFKDPAWDMLLQLYADSISGQRSSVTSLCIASGSPSTTALRWLNTLISEGLVIRRPDPLDARRVFVGLSQEGAAAMERYFRSLP